ncbi:MAG: DUF362 domain-containing protein [Candidatus Aminicenantes bacterium]|nr:DUF362 domain-containing protein [Candidatus Aminicenantes bacterium]
MSSKVYFIPAKREDGNEVLAQKAERVFLKTALHEQIENDSFVAIKIHFGEKRNTGYIKPQWIINIIRQIKKITSRVFITDSNTLYVGSRSNSVEHLLLAEEHGFKPEILGIPAIIADGLIGRDDGEIQVNLKHVKSAKVGSLFLNSDAMICLSHFTGHIQSGFGGAIKNLGMGCASRAGKLEQHSDVHPWINSKLCSNCGVCFDYCPAQAIVEKGDKAFIIEDKCIGCGECLVVCSVGAVKFNWDSDSVRVQEKMSEYAYSLRHFFNGRINFINFLIEVTKDCDCMSKDQPAVVEDIGILGSLDPVAIDQASADLVNEKSGKDILRAGYDMDWSVQLEHGVEIGLGSRHYDLIKL